MFHSQTEGYYCRCTFLYAISKHWNQIFDVFHWSIKLWSWMASLHNHEFCSGIFFWRFRQQLCLADDSLTVEVKSSPQRVKKTIILENVWAELIASANIYYILGAHQSHHKSTSLHAQRAAALAVFSSCFNLIL